MPERAVADLGTLVIELLNPHPKTRFVFCSHSRHFLRLLSIVCYLPSQFFLVSTMMNRVAGRAVRNLAFQASRRQVVPCTSAAFFQRAAGYSSSSVANMSTMDDLKSGTSAYMNLYPEASTDGSLRLGNIVPDFAADTTHGKWDSFHEWKKGKVSTIDKLISIVVAQSLF